jgi:hypothetical protein
MILLTELHYHPNIAYFSRTFLAESLLIEAHENYLKQTFRNRCEILTDQGKLALTVPIKGGSKKTLITALEIDYSQNWVNTHWRTIKSAYSNSPYFEFYADYFKTIYDRRPPLLFELNLEFLQLYLRFLKIGKPLSYTSRYEEKCGAGVSDLRNTISPKNEPDNMAMESYVQVFGKQFARNLSILDLLFNLGPQAGKYLEQTAVNCLNK